MSTKSIHRRRLDDYAARIVDRAATARLTPADLRQTKLAWYSIVNSDDDDQATVYVYDEVGGTFGVDAEQFAKDLAEITAPMVHVRINSPGGGLFDGIAIYNSLLAHPSKVTVHVDGIAASIASVIAMAGDEVVMGPGSQMMIHDALGIELGNAEDHNRMATFLDRQSDNIAEIYQRRAGGDAGQWRQRMLAETWLFAGEAIELGLADRVDDTPAPDPDDDDLDVELQDLMSRTFNVADRFRYAGRGAAPDPAAVVNVAGRPQPAPAPVAAEPAGDPPLQLPANLGDMFKAAVADAAAEPFHLDPDVFRTAVRDRSENAPAPTVSTPPAAPATRIDVNDIVNALREGLR